MRGRDGGARRGRGEMLSLQGRRRRRQQREREEGGNAGRGQPKAGPGGWTGCWLRCSRFRRPLSCVEGARLGQAGGRRSLLSMVQKTSMSRGPYHHSQGDPHGGLRPQPTGEV